MRLRAAVMNALGNSDAHLTTSAEAQAVEARIQRLGEAAAGGATGPDIGQGPGGHRSTCCSRLVVSAEEWDILYRQRLKLECPLPATGAPSPVPSASAGARAAAGTNGGSRRMSTVTVAARRTDVRGGQRAHANQFDSLLLVLAIVSMTAFVALTAALLNHIVFPFDQPILAFFHGLGRHARDLERRLPIGELPADRDRRRAGPVAGLEAPLPRGRHRRRPARRGDGRQRGRQGADGAAASRGQRRRDPRRRVQLSLGPHPRMPDDPGHRRDPLLADLGGATCCGSLLLVAVVDRGGPRRDRENGPQ